MLIPISNLNLKTTTLNIVIVREKSNYITIFRLFVNITQNINSGLIYYSIHINNFLTMSDIKFNS